MKFTCKQKLEYAKAKLKNAKAKFYFAKAFKKIAFTF